MGLQNFETYLIDDATIRSHLLDLRKDIIQMAQHSAHVGPALSCVDILATLYYSVLKILPGDIEKVDRNYFILSKGHGCMALYAVLAQVGFFPKEQLLSYARNHSDFGEHPLANKVPGIEFATGSLGHGLAIGAGMAKSLKIQGMSSMVFVLLGDGECDEGSVWESVAISVSHKLDNLIAVIDMNGLQACGKCSDISPSIYLPGCWNSFGWDVEEVDGHDYIQMSKIFNRSNNKGKPKAIFCHTIKGKGVPFMENNLLWHYKPVCGQKKKNALESLSDA